jgi:hypothetical protein
MNSVRKQIRSEPMVQVTDQTEYQTTFQVQAECQNQVWGQMAIQVNGLTQDQIWDETK